MVPLIVCPHMVEGERELFCTLIKTLIPFPKTLPPNTIILGVISSIFKFEGAGQKHSDSSTLNISEGKLIYWSIFYVHVLCYRKEINTTHNEVYNISYIIGSQHDYQWWAYIWKITTQKVEHIRGGKNEKIWLYGKDKPSQRLHRNFFLTWKDQNCIKV